MQVKSEPKVPAMKREAIRVEPLSTYLAKWKGPDLGGHAGSRWFDFRETESIMAFRAPCKHK